MGWRALHVDGFTCRLLSYDLFVERGVATLTASWFSPEPTTADFKSQFMIDDARVTEYVSSLRSQAECSGSESITDQSHQTIIIEACEERIERHFYGGKWCASGQFKELFDWIHEQVVAQLPWSPEIKEKEGAEW